ncbi:class I SAM-dependent methyltransferase [Candidatus Woesearchaeota archaeon]|nr:class I SAM-dependent methyltransferase [Candidatus Woesearchaeota archaeon]
MRIPKYYKESFEMLVPKLYDFVVNISFFGNAKKIRLKAIKQIPKNSKKIIDLATGTGELAILTKKLFPKSNIIGIDLSNGMLERAKKKAKNKKLNISFLRRNIEDTKFPSNNVDAVIIGLALHEIPEKPRIRVLKKAYKLLKKNKVFVIMDLNKPKNIIFRNIFKLYLRIFEPDYNRANKFLDYDLERELKKIKFKYIRTSYHYLHSVKIITCKK